jgi:hypothetical protein
VIKKLISFATGMLFDRKDGVVVEEVARRLSSATEYLPSPLFDGCVVSPTISAGILQYLTENYSRISLGDKVLTETSLLTKLGGSSKPVNREFLFETQSKALVFYRGFEVVFVTTSMESMNGIQMTWLRGTVDYKSIAIAAHKRSVSATEANYMIHGRYRSGGITKVIGRDVGSTPSGGDFNWKTGLLGAELNGEEPKDQVVKRRISSGGILSQVNTSTHKPLYEIGQVIGTSYVHDAFETLFYDQDVQDVIDQVNTWSSNRPWYEERGIPWKRGVLLYGPGGTGKTSLAKSLASSLGLHVYQYFLSTLSDAEFLREWGGMNTPCMVLFEDFDNVFHLRENITPQPRLSFDCVLNAISGISTKDGVLLVVTTNDIAKIDPAMGISMEEGAGKHISTRPGRLDVAIRIGEMNEENRTKMALNILRDWPEIVGEVVALGEGMVPVRFQELCIQKAFERI